MTYVTAGRNIDFIASGMQITGATYLPSGQIGVMSGHMPIIRELPFNTCLDTLINLQGARHISYAPQDLGAVPNPVPAGLPIVATVLTCCDAVCTQTRVEEPCYAGGICPTIKAIATNVDNCPSAQGVRTNLAYNSGNLDISGNIEWRGTLDLRGGGLELRFACQSGVAFNDPSKFRLTWRGCGSGQSLVGFNYSNPLFVNFGNITVPNCCDCANTTENATINVFFQANCNPTVYSRHIGYDVSGVTEQSNMMTGAVPELSDWHYIMPLAITNGISLNMESRFDECSDCNFGDWAASESIAGNNYGEVHAYGKRSTHNNPQRAIACCLIMVLEAKK